MHLPLICVPEEDSWQEDRVSRIRSANSTTVFIKQLLHCFSKLKKQNQNKKPKQNQKNKNKTKNQIKTKQKLKNPQNPKTKQKTKQIKIQSKQASKQTKPPTKIGYCLVRKEKKNHTPVPDI